MLSLAYLIVKILLSFAPKTNTLVSKIPSTSAKYSASFSLITSLELIQLMSISFAKVFQACFNHLTTDKYASCNLTYFPTK
ncbi:hypothetical protein FE74_15395, partial [Staphylococcus aureus]